MPGGPFIQVIAKSTPALAIAAVTYISKSIIDKLDDNLNPTEISASKGEIKVTFEPKKVVSVQNTAPQRVHLDEYETAVAKALKNSGDGVKWTVSEE
ncbi:MAG: hypothetical protein JJ858_04045 [Rhizobiaceae bacterium]|nr:hypothetical protein [Rhizobiaceae bacterium]